MPTIRLDVSVLNAVYVPQLKDERRIQFFSAACPPARSVPRAACCVPNTLQERNYLVTRKVGRTLRDNCRNECMKAVSRMGLARYFAVNKSDMSIMSVVSGTQILFAGPDDRAALRLARADGAASWTVMCTRWNLRALERTTRPCIHPTDAPRARWTKRLAPCWTRKTPDRPAIR